VSKEKVMERLRHLEIKNGSTWKFLAVVLLLLLVSTFSLTGQQSGPLKLYMPSGIALDPDQSVYIADTGNCRIVFIPRLDGKDWLALGELGYGPKKFKAPKGIAVDSRKRIYVADPGNALTVRIDDISGSNWIAASNNAVSIAFSRIGELFGLSGKIMILNENLLAGDKTFGIPGKGKGHFNMPCSIVVGSKGEILIADAKNARIVQVDNINGENWQSYDAEGSGIGKFNKPSGIAIDSKNRIYVTDSANNRIVRMDNIGGKNLISFGKAGSGRNEFMYPYGIALDEKDRIYIVDQFNNRIVRIDDFEGKNWVTLGENQ
jgi:DNA-binding beta-propeller fold protein YncE